MQQDRLPYYGLRLRTIVLEGDPRAPPSHRRFWTIHLRYMSVSPKPWIKKKGRKGHICSSRSSLLILYHSMAQEKQAVPGYLQVLPGHCRLQKLQQKYHCGTAWVLHLHHRPKWIWQVSSGRRLHLIASGTDGMPEGCRGKDSPCTGRGRCLCARGRQCSAAHQEGLRSDQLVPATPQRCRCRSKGKSGSVPDAKVQIWLVYLKYWTLNLMHLMVYPKVLFHPKFSIKGQASCTAAAVLP